MEIAEGQVFEGTVAALGSEGPQMRWLVVNPGGKIHAHSLGDPLDLHCMPFGILRQSIDQGRLSLVESLPQHPIIRLQREKEARGLIDTHMGLRGDLLEGMLRFLADAVSEDADYARFLAGEILAMSAAGGHSDSELVAIRGRVKSLTEQG